MSKTETISVLPMNGTLADLQNYIEHLEAENAIMRKLSTRKGFYSRYFSNLKISETAIEAFNRVNKEYYSLFGNHRFTDYESFKRMVALNGN